MSGNTRTKSKAKSSSEEVVQEILNPEQYVTLGVVSQLIQVQERMFKTFLETITKRVDNLADQVTSLQVSLEFSQRTIDDHKDKISLLEKEVNDSRDEIKNLQSSMTKVTDKSVYLENQSRRSNLRIEGVAEEKGENWSKTEEKLTIALETELNLDFTPKIERAHRTGKSVRKDGISRPRTIVAKFYDWKEKEAVLRQARYLKPRHITIYEDLAEETVKKRKEQLPKLKEAKASGKIAYFNLDKLVIKDKTFRNTDSGF